MCGSVTMHYITALHARIKKKSPFNNKTFSIAVKKSRGLLLEMQNYLYKHLQGSGTHSRILFIDFLIQLSQFWCCTLLTFLNT